MKGGVKCFVAEGAGVESLSFGRFGRFSLNFPTTTLDLELVSLEAAAV